MPPRLFAGRGHCECTPERAFYQEERYGMWLLSVEKALALPALRPHQDLKRDGLLVEYDDAMHGRVIFVSHQFAALKLQLQRWYLMDVSMSNRKGLLALCERLRNRERAATGGSDGTTPTRTVCSGPR